MSSLALRSSHLRSALRLLFTVITALAFSVSLFGQSHVRIVRLSEVDGDVQMDRADSRGFNPAYLNMPVVNESKVWARQGQAEVELDDGSSIRLTPDTIVAFRELSADADGGRITVLELTQGTAYFNIRYQDADDFRLEFGHEQVELNKSAHFRVNIEQHEMRLAVLSGEVTVANGAGAEIAVKKDETIHLNSEDTQHYDLAKGIDVENYDTWDSERAADHDQHTTNAVIWNGTGGSTQSVSGGSYWFPGTLLIGSYAGSCWNQYSAFGSPLYPGWWPNGVAFSNGGFSPFPGYGGCPSYYSNWNNPYWNQGYVFVPTAPMFHSPTHPRHGPGGIISGNGPSARPHSFVIDNDAIAQRYHGSTAAVESTAAVPAQGLVATTPSVSTSPVALAPIGTRTPPNRPMMPAVMPSRPEIHSPAVATASPQRTASSGPAMRPNLSSGGPRMSPSTSGGGGARMSSPSMASGGGMRMSSPAMSSGGMHSSGASMGGGAHSSGGSHR